MVIYGASDDLVEVESEHSELAAEYDVGGDGMCCVVITSDGGGAFDVLRVRFTSDRPDGLWRIEHEVKSGALEVAITTPPDDSDDYTQRATCSGDIIATHKVAEWPLSVRLAREALRHAELADHVDAMSDDEVQRIVEIFTGLRVPAALWTR